MGAGQPQSWRTCRIQAEACRGPGLFPSVLIGGVAWTYRSSEHGVRSFPLRSWDVGNSVVWMKILFLGDIVGKPGREAVLKGLARLREEHQVDWVVANAENSAGGSGLTAAIARELVEAGVDGITLGDHVWDQRGFADDIGSLERVCRPANLPPECPGRRILVLEKAGVRLAVFTLLGRHFMKIQADCPFRAADSIFRELDGGYDLALVEIHAETTSEKVAMGWYLDGRATLVVGTHTHIPTADACVLPRGTAYQTDAGMTGPYESVLGREIQPILAKLMDGLPRQWPVATGDVRICGTLVTVDLESGCASDCRAIMVSAGA